MTPTKKNVAREIATRAALRYGKVAQVKRTVTAVYAVHNCLNRPHCVFSEFTCLTPFVSPFPPQPNFSLQRSVHPPLPTRMVFTPKDRIRSLISQVTEANLHSICEEIHYHIRPEGDREIIQAIAISIIDEAAGPGHTLVPQYHLAGVCWAIHDLCCTPGHGAGSFLSVSLPQRLSELCQKEFADANRKLEDDEDTEMISSIVLDLVVLIGELYKLGLVEDEVMKKVYLENLHCGYKGSDVKAEALCLLLDFLATRWDMDPTSRNIDVERYVRSLLDYVERHDPPSALVDEIRVGLRFVVVWCQS